MSGESIVIVAAKRIPTGSYQGAYQTISSTQLGTTAIKGALEAQKYQLRILMKSLWDVCSQQD